MSSAVIPRLAGQFAVADDSSADDGASMIDYRGRTRSG